MSWRDDPASAKQLALLESQGCDASPATKGEASDLISELKGPGPTYRERRQARAERLRGWADTREAKSEAAYEGTREIADMIPIGQPILVGHHSESRHRRDLDRIDRGMRATVENGRKADEFRSRADNIERAADQAIYSDDPDAIERLREKLETLEAKREQMKARNAEFRKAHKAELKGMSPYERDRAMPHQGYEITNLGGNISRTRNRLATMERGQ